MKSRAEGLVRRQARLLCDPPARARRTLAVSAALLEAHRRGLAPDSLRLHGFLPSVVLGCGGDAEAEADLPWCRRAGVELARRPTAGGAVVMDPGVPCWELVLRRRRGLEALDRVGALACGAVASVLEGCGLEPEVRPPGSVLVAGAKLGGVAGCFDGTTLLLQGSLLIDPDPALLCGALRSQRFAVARLADLTPPPRRDALLRRLVAALAEAFALDLHEGALSAPEKQIAERLYRERIGRDDFVLGAVALQEV